MDHLIYHNCSHSLPTLDLLVSQRPSRTKVFVTYHDDVGEKVIRRFSCNYTRSWVVPVFCNATKYFEYYSYKKLSKLSLEGDLKDVDYVMMTGYKTLVPREWGFSYGGDGVYGTDDIHIQSMIQFAVAHPEHEVFPFFIPTMRSRVISMMKGPRKYHGRESVEGIKATLKALSWSDADIADSLWAVEMYRNTYLAKTATFHRVAKSMTEFMNKVDSDPNLEAFFDYNAHYSLQKVDVAMKAYGTPYYKLHCFVMERMIPMFFDHLKANPSPTLMPEVLKFARKLPV